MGFLSRIISKVFLVNNHDIPSLIPLTPNGRKNVPNSVTFQSVTSNSSPTSSCQQAILRGLITLTLAGISQVPVVTNNNPIGLNISNEIVSVHLRGSRNRGELWLASLAMNCHDMKVEERRMVFNLNHAYSMAEMGEFVKGFFSCN